MKNELLDLCQRINGWSDESPYEILSAAKKDDDNSVVIIKVRVREAENEQPE